MIKILKAFDAKENFTCSCMKVNENVYKSAKKYPRSSVIPVNNINVYDILKYEKFIVTKDAVSKIEEVYANEANIVMIL